MVGASDPSPATAGSVEPAARRGRGRFNLEIRQHVSPLRQTLVLAGGLGVGLIATAIVLMAAGVSLGGIYEEFIVSIFSTSMSVPALLKLRLGINEIISTLLLNYVAFNFLLYLLYGPWKDPVSAFPHSEQYE